MESFDTFMEQFVKFKANNADKPLSNVLKNAASLFEQLSTNEIGLVLHRILGDEKGLLTFLKSGTDSTMEKSWIETFNLLDFIVEKFHRLLEAYANGIKDVCDYALTAKLSSRIKQAADGAFQRLIELCPGYGLDLEKTVEACVNRFHLSSESDRRHYFKILGTIAKRNPESMSDRNSYKIFSYLMNDMEETVATLRKASREAIPRKIAAYMDALNDMLLHFTPKETPKKSEEYCEALYHLVDKYSNVPENQTTKLVNRAAISLLGKHMHFFCEHVYKNAQKWHDTLWLWIRWPGDQGTSTFNALVAYYEMLGQKLSKDTTNYGQKLFQNLKLFLEQNLVRENVDARTMRLCISGFGDMAAACKVHLAKNELESMYTFIARESYIAYLDTDGGSTSIENLAYYQLALSKILVHAGEISREQLNTLSYSSTNLTKRFPELPVTSHSLVVKSTVKTIWNLKEICARSCEEFMKKIVYEGIKWSCSHALFVDPEIEREDGNSEKEPIAYKNYVPLWESLLRPSSVARNAESLWVSRELSKEVPRACSVILSKLNLKVTTLEDISREEEDEEDTLEVLVAENETDYRIFVNLVNLFEAMVEKLAATSMRSEISALLCDVIRKCYEHPMIPGLYKLAELVLRLRNAAFEEPEAMLDPRSSRVLAAYSSMIVDEYASLSEEAQFACLRVIFAIPTSTASLFFPRLAPIFKTAFASGQRLDLAQEALSALEKWTKMASSDELEPLLTKILPNLGSFLRNEDRDSRGGRSIDSSAPRRGRRRLKRNVILKDDEKTLREFQRRVLLFFGSLSSKVVSSLSEENSQDVDLELGCGQQVLKLTMLYSDVKPDLYLDVVLPRVIELSLNSTDRKTKVLACELLHSMVIVMLGTSVKFLASNPDHVLPVFKTIYPVLLTLASDTDPVIQQLFFPLTIQLSHWYSSKMKRLSSETAFLVECLFDSLAYEPNLATTDFSGLCLVEFVRWSVKQSDDEDDTNAMINIVPIIGKIVNFAQHPSIERRIGAATAFNYLYAVLREHEEIMDRFCLQLLFAFVKSLEGCNNPKISNALKHIEKIIRCRHDILNVVNDQRSKPDEFQGSTLRDAAQWLLIKCTSLDRDCRAKSIQLLESIAKYLPNGGSTRDVIEDYSKEHGPNAWVDAMLNDSAEPLEPLTSRSMLPFLRTIECYSWILRENLINVDVLFGEGNSNRNVIFDRVAIIVRSVTSNPRNEGLDLDREKQRVDSLKARVILEIFDFLSELFEKTENGVILVPNGSLTPDLFSLISSCIFEPKTVYFDDRNLTSAELLPSHVERLLTTMHRVLSAEYSIALKRSIGGVIDNGWEKCCNVENIISRDNSLDFNDYFKGLIFLGNYFDSCDYFQVEEKIRIDEIVPIANCLCKEKFGKMNAIELDADTKERLSNFLELLLMKFGVEAVITLLNVAKSKVELYHPDSRIIPQGRYFFKVFARPIFGRVLRNVGTFVDTLTLSSLEENFDTSLTLMEELLVYVKDNKREYESLLLDLGREFVNRFSAMHSLINYSHERKRKVVGLYAMLVRLLDSPQAIFQEARDLFAWITRDLCSSYSTETLDYKTQILRDFLPHLVWHLNDRELKECLYKLKSDHFPPDASIVRSELVATFQTVLRYLPVLKSVALFDCAHNLTIGNLQYFWDKSACDTLGSYFDSIPAKDAAESLDILLRCFLHTEEPASRLRVLDQLLAPNLRRVVPEAVELFCGDNVNEILRTISQSSSSTETKIGCYNVLEIMLAKVPLEKIDGDGATIAGKCDETIKDGHTLLKLITLRATSVNKTGLPEDVADKNAARRLCCAAYNCLVAAICLKREAQLYGFLFFTSNTNKTWQNIVDGDKKYEFGDNLGTIAKERRRLVCIRKRNTDPSNTSSVSSSVKSYNIAASTLNDDASRYDLHESRLVPQPGESNEQVPLMSLTFECDEVNDHECMASICGAIKHISENITVLPTDSEPQMPKWMACFRHSLVAATSYNARLFFVKVILNTCEAFRPFAKHFVSPILSFLIDNVVREKKISYLARDVLVMLMEWKEGAVPTGGAEKQVAQDLLERLISHAPSKQRRLYVYNLEVISSLVSAWPKSFELNDNVARIANNSARLGASIFLVFARNGKQEWLTSRSDVLDHLIRLLGDHDEEVVTRSCETIGMVLSFLANSGTTEKQQVVLENLEASLVPKSYKDPKKFIGCVHAICEHFSGIAELYWPKVMLKFRIVDDFGKEKCLDVFLAAMPKMNAEEVTTELGYAGFVDILGDKVSTCQNVALKILRKLVDILQPEELLPIAALAVPYSKSAAVEQRRTVADIFTSIRARYGDRIDEDNSASELLSLSRRVLFLGLLDTDEDLQREILDFCSGVERTDRAIDRLSELLDAYDPDLEASFLQIFASMMLQLLGKDPGFDKKMFEPLTECRFEDYKVVGEWRSRNPGLVAPLFTSSLASQMSQYYSQANPAFARFSQTLNRSLFLRVSQTPKFSQTLREGPGTIPGAPVTEAWTLPEPSTNARSKRFLNDSSDVRDLMRNKQIQKKARRDEFLRNAHRRKDDVQIFRKYRIGDFPDTEISYSSLIVPLEKLAKMDRVVAKEMTVALFSSTLNELYSEKRDEFLTKISASVKFMFDNSRADCSTFIGSMLEILLNSREIEVSPLAISKVARSSGMLSLGALALEERMIYCHSDFGPETKRAKICRNNDQEDQNEWLQLASIYKSLNDFDVVESIFERDHFGENLRAASFAQSAGRWMEATTKYEEAIDVHEEPIKDYCLESLLACLAHLSDWNEIGRRIGDKLNNDIDALWEIPSKKNWLMSWTLQYQIRATAMDHSSQDLVVPLESWLKDEEKMRQLKEVYGEEMALISARENPRFADHCLSHGLEKIRQEWMRLNPLYQEQKVTELLRLRGLTDAKMYLKATEQKNHLKTSVVDLFDFWNKSTPMSDDDLLLWDRHVVYRIYLLSMLRDQIQDSETDLVTKIDTTIVRQCLNIADAASIQRNLHVSENFLKYSEGYTKTVDPIWRNEWKFVGVKYHSLCFAENQDPQQRCRFFTMSWKVSHKLIERDFQNIRIRNHVANLCDQLRQLVAKGDPVGLELLRSKSVLGYVPSEARGVDSRMWPVEYGLIVLKECCSLAEGKAKAKCYLSLLTFCHSLILTSDRTDLSKEFIGATLRAMEYGSAEAARYFPCLLNLDLSDSELREEFDRVSSRVEIWMFLKWHAQLLSHLGTPLQRVVASLLSRLAETYPNAIAYTFGVSMRVNQNLLEDPFVARLGETIWNNTESRNFINAVKHVVQPELILQYHLNKMPLTRPPNESEAIRDLLKSEVGGYDKGTPFRGNLYKDILSFRGKINSMDSMNAEDLIAAKRQLNEALKTRMEKHRRVTLKSYSPWLCKFRGGDQIEVPGQYSGDSRPRPRFHARIVKLESSVKVLQSLRRPVRITMLGNDGRRYKFLVKFGEDLRLDQRIEQLFVLMNRILATDEACQRRRLSLSTYQVIPLSESLGLIQWIDATSSLDEMLERKEQRERIAKQYSGWMNAAAPGKNTETVYRESTFLYSPENVEAQFEIWRGGIPRDALRRALKKISPSYERFFVLRRNFIASYATMCVAQWVLGIGDRHLSNILLFHHSGKALGVDFGYSFDTALNLPVPELVPFRLTPQILELLLPFDEHGLLKVSMIHVLRALRAGKEPLLACMDIFVKEPSLDWQVRKKMTNDVQEGVPEDEGNTNVQWHPTKRINITRAKLHGTKPSELILSQMKDRYGDTKYLSKYSVIVNGTDNGQRAPRSLYEDENLSVEQQVACLLDTATDVNILGRMWVGWEPWL